MPKSVGLALGGGGARGWAHIGVLRALEAHQIPIDYIAGTSIGALVGAIYVQDALHKLESFAEDISMDNLLSFMDISFPGLGLVDGRRVRDFLASYLTDARIEDCKIPFRSVATNFLMKEEVVFKSGSMVDAVRASISLPGVFVPFKQKSTYLVDGGVVNPVPVSVIKALGADAIIAVNLNKDPRAESPPSKSESASPTSDAQQSENPSEASTSDSAQDTEQQEESEFAEGLVDRYQNLQTILKDQIDDWMPDPETGMNIFDVIGNSINMMEQQVTRVRLETDKPQILIEPDLMEFGIFDFQQAQPMIQRGYQATEAVMAEIKQLLES